MSNNDLETLSVNTIRTVCMDAIQAADSGHPGTPMGILTGVQSVDPDYEVLVRPAVTLDDLRTFRRLGSRCPGHPEYRWTSGVETTTDPLGQGVATSVGMAIAGQWLAARYNRDDFTVFDFHVYVMAVFTEDVAARFIGYGWNVTTVADADADDLDALACALHTFTSENERPTLIVVHSHIGYGSPVEDTPKAHGEPFGVEGVKSTKRFLGIPEDQDLFVPGGVYEYFAAGVGARGHEARTSWEARFEAYRTTHPELADELGRIQRRCVCGGESRGPMGSTASARPSLRSATTRRRTR